MATGSFSKQKKAVSKVNDLVILHLFQDPNTLYIRSRNKFGMTRFASILTFETATFNLRLNRFPILAMDSRLV
jgi:hypothetical protein